MTTGGHMHPYWDVHIKFFETFNPTKAKPSTITANNGGSFVKQVCDEIKPFMQELISKEFALL